MIHLFNYNIHFVLNIISKFSEHEINIKKILINIIIKLSLILATYFLFIITKVIGNKFIKKIFFNSKNKKLDSGQIKTIYILIKNIFYYAIMFCFFYIVLSILGIPIATLITSAGIASVAIGLGAKGFITDIVNGIFILIEHQFIVGDYVNISNINGLVKSIGLRTTQILSDNGTLYFIPNRKIIIVSNMSRYPVHSVINIRINENTDILKMKKVIEKVNQKSYLYKSSIIKGPIIKGIVDIGEGLLAFQIIIVSKLKTQSQIQNYFLNEYIQELKKEKVQFIINNSTSKNK